MDWIKWTMGFIGHIGFWCVLFNRIHATAWPRKTRKYSEKSIALAVVLPLIWIAITWFMGGSSAIEALFSNPIVYVYYYSCIFMAALFASRWIWRKASFRSPESVIDSKTEWLDINAELDAPLRHGVFAKTLGLIPFNEVLKLTRQRMTIGLDVPGEMDGLKICQLSDLHFTGQIDIQYFKRIVEEANKFQPDLILVTGDIVDELSCLDWIDETIGNLQARLGVYYVLGNHDRRIYDENRLRDCISKAGLIQASDQWHETEFQGTSIQITGNELPWYRDANALPAQPNSNSDLKILLSHSPDQLDWALDRDFDLMFAGHTHGGQIALPFIGPLVAPSKYGVLYAAGTFQIGRLLMHVSRGISGDRAIRICSPPELGLFTIRSNNLPGKAK